MVIVIIKNSHTIKAGSLSTGFRKVSKMCKRATFAFVLGIFPNPLTLRKKQ